MEKITRYRKIQSSSIKQGTMKAIVLALVVALAAAVSAQYIEEDIEAWHFHTYFFEVNQERTAEAIDFRKALRAKINDGSMPHCSLNRLYVGWDGPHPVSQFELCCNATGYNTANSFHTQNHGNLSVLIHPLTIYDLNDHLGSTAWLGEPVVLDHECPCLYPVLPKPRPCPVYPEYPDELTSYETDYINYVPLPGSEDEAYHNYKLSKQ